MIAKKRKALAVFMAIVLVTGTILSGLTWVPDKARASGTGSGTATDPYIITTAEQLNNIRNSMGASYKLGNDLDLSGYVNWAPIGTSIQPFSGGFDGDGHTITGLTIDNFSNSYVGLFGYVDTAGQIRNVHLSGVNVLGGTNVGGLVGYIKQGKIENSSVSGAVNGANQVGGLAGKFDSSAAIAGSSAHVTVGGQNYLGGLIGQYSSTAAMRDNFATGNVRGAGFVGGLIGDLNKGGNVINSYASGNLEAGSMAGGLIGSTGSSRIESSHATGNISSTAGQYVGGLIGTTSNTTIERCYAAGNITITQGNWLYAGGLVGYSTGVINNSYATGNVTAVSVMLAVFGGLVGGNIMGQIQNSYSVGAVTSGGGLVSSNNGGTITGSYYDKNTSGQSDTGKGTPKTTAEMKAAATYSGWDFTTVWSIKGGDYPKLRYSVTYDKNGATAGTAPTDGNWYAPGSSAPIQGNTAGLTRDGYAFVGWSPDPDGRGTVYAAGETYPMGTLNVTLYAVWTPVTYTIAPLGEQTFSVLQEGYAPGTQEPKTVTVTRTGTGDLTNLTVRLNGTDADAFEVVGPAATTLDSGTPSTTFTVKAKNSLSEGTYHAMVTVTADHMADVTFTVEQTVNKKARIKGDGTGDGKVTVADSGMITKYIQGKITLTPEQFEALDMNGDGKLTVEDADLIHALYVGGQ
ncbi:GLUG motif-containing protein [Gorillibacterium sp. sgz500922]|uniref:GLUG motif-containing protein n=1 Tax=Gorillibacterium sp. sgz500922 TaxID=3446694 RepID=UPI003F67FD1A